MTDRLTPPAKAHQPAPVVTLASRGKTWGRLLDGGRYLEVKRHGQMVTFDLWASARAGHAVVVSVVEEESGE